MSESKHVSQGLVCGVLPLPVSRRARVPEVTRVRLAARGERELRVMSIRYACALLRTCLPAGTP